MLNYIRNSTIGLILAFVFMLSLFFFKSGGNFSGVAGVGANDVAVVQDIKITNLQFLRTYDLSKNQFTQLLGTELNNKQAKSLGIDKQALSILINEAMFLNEFIEKDLIIDETIIAKKTKNYIPSIYDQNKINEQKLNNFLSNQNLNLKELLKIINSQSLKEIYENSIINNTSYPDSASIILTKYQNHLRDIQYLKLPLENLNFEISENEELIKEFYENNKNLFFKPEKRDIEYISINSKNYNNTWNISSNELSNYYENNKNEFINKEKRKFVQFNFNNEIDAENFLKKIDNTNSIKKIINLANKEKIKYIEQEFKYKNEILSNIGNKLFNLKKGNISEIINSPIAYHIVFLQDIIPEKVLDFKSSKIQIENKLKDIKSNDYVQNLIEKIDEDIFNNLSLLEISNKHNIDILKLSNVANDNNIKNSTLENKIIQESFKINLNITSDIFEGVENGDYFILNVSKILKKNNKKYVEAKNDVLKQWKNNQIKEKIKDFIVKIKMDNDLEFLSKKYNSNLLKIEINKSNKEFPSNFLNSIFNSNTNELIFFDDDKYIYIGKVNSIIINDENSVVDFNNYNVSIYNEIRNSILSEISKKFSIKINENLLNSLVSDI